MDTVIEPDVPYILSHYQAEILLKAEQAKQPQTQISLDLGLSHLPVVLAPKGVTLPDGQQLSWQQIKKIHKKTNACFQVRDGQIAGINTFSEMTQRVYSLMPTNASPAMIVSGFLMHRIKDIDPQQDAQEKINCLQPLHGNVLDTATGLGYTAILAARQATRVTTIELDPAAQEMARANPWSTELFTRPNIAQLMGDSADLVGEFADASFDCIIHDPPDISLGGQLYAGSFYGELQRILKAGGVLFHYIGNPDSNKAAKLMRQAARRLQEAGFRKPRIAHQAHGLLTKKKA